ncbi:MAG: Flp pilus assembly protein CpaB [Candidatus Omnitrophica bacterium]|nr:Flp pilus assembly protein CpaB [Candidatus Omnitrophota bacterium]
MQRQKLFLIVGVVLFLVAVFMLSMHQEEQRKVTQRANVAKGEQTKVRKAKILIARRDLPPGIQIDERLAVFEAVPEPYIQPGAVTSFERIAGLVTVSRIAQGEQITLSRLALPSVGNLSSVTPSGKRAISIPVDAISSVGGMIKPGDYVDVIATLAIPMTGPEGKPIAQAQVVPLFQNIQVLAVGQEIDIPKEKKEKGRYQQEEGRKDNLPLITLAMTPQQANLISFVQEQGRLRLILRSPGDSEIRAVPLASWDALFQYIIPQLPQPSVEEMQAIQEKPERKNEYVEVYRGLHKEEIVLGK